MKIRRTWWDILFHCHLHAPLKYGTLRSGQAIWKRQISVYRRIGKVEKAVDELSQFLDTFYTDVEGWLELVDIYSSCNQSVSFLLFAHSNSSSSPLLITMHLQVHICPPILITCPSACPPKPFLRPASCRDSVHSRRHPIVNTNVPYGRGHDRRWRFCCAGRLNPNRYHCTSVVWRKTCKSSARCHSSLRYNSVLGSAHVGFWKNLGCRHRRHLKRLYLKT